MGNLNRCINLLLSKLDYCSQIKKSKVIVKLKVVETTRSKTKQLK